MNGTTTATWREWLEHRLPEEVINLFIAEWLITKFELTAADRNAAWALYTEMRMRILTQPLHYRSGDEIRALESVAELFPFTRKTIRGHGRSCRCFAILASTILNGVVRQFTAKWHKRQKAGDLALEDVRHEFRAELAQLQRQLEPFQAVLGEIAEDTQFVPGTESPKTVTEATATEDRPPTTEAVQDTWWPAAAADRKSFLLQQFEGDIPFRIDFASEVSDDQADAIHRHEKAAIVTRRLPAQDADQNSEITNLTGLAISGGGIRSATFALGVLQRLAQQGLLREVDYLSTVSGGGYVGSFLSSYLNSPPADALSGHRRSIGLQRGELPFLNANETESAALRWLRNHSKYLLFGGQIRRLQIFGLTIYGVLINLFLTVPVVAFFVLLTQWIYGPELALTRSYDTWPGYPAAGWPGSTLWWALAIAVVIALVLGPVQRCCQRTNSTAKEFLRWYEWIGAWTLPVLLLIASFNLLPMLAYGTYHLVNYVPHTLPDLGLGLNGSEILSAIASLVPLLAAAGSYLAKGHRVLAILTRALFAISGPLFLFTCYLLLMNWFVVDEPAMSGWFGFTKTSCMYALLAVPAVYGLLFLNVNFSAPHRYYRNRLSEAYLLQENPRSAAERQPDRCVKPVDPQKLSQMRDRNPVAPYHLINAALNVPGSEVADLRGRDCDFFLFSQGYCGSRLTGYMQTAQLEKRDWHLDLGTAMAISGAAAAPYMGVNTDRTFSFLMTLLNIRLGYWLPNPGCRSLWQRWVRWWFPANAVCLIREMFGLITPDHTRVFLSDGGHIENLGLYELLRRRCKFIVAIDGEQDGNLNCPSLHTLIRYAAIDLNADIRFPDLHDLKKDAHGFSASHFTLGVIRYQPVADRSPDIGLILYFKSSLTGNEPATVLNYHREHSDFPHQTTADQFFHEDQFEAYRALGDHIASEALREELFDGPPLNELTISNWFRALVTKLLSD